MLPSGCSTLRFHPHPAFLCTIPHSLQTFILGVCWIGQAPFPINSVLRNHLIPRSSLKSLPLLRLSPRKGLVKVFLLPSTSFLLNSDAVSTTSASPQSIQRTLSSPTHSQLPTLVFHLSRLKSRFLPVPIPGISIFPREIFLLVIRTSKGSKRANSSWSPSFNSLMTTIFIALAWIHTLRCIQILSSPLSLHPCHMACSDEIFLEKHKSSSSLQVYWDLSLRFTSLSKCLSFTQFEKYTVFGSCQFTHICSVLLKNIQL